jgi:hypothetical protein
MRRLANRYSILLFTDIEGVSSASVERYGDVLATQPFLLHAATPCDSSSRAPVIIAIVRIRRPCSSTPAGSIAFEPHPTSSRWLVRWGIPLASSG